MSGHVAPHNIEAEQTLLGAILINNAALSVVDRLIEPSHFLEPFHQEIYEHARNFRVAFRRVS